MRAAKMLAVLAIAALGIGSFSAVALAGKSYKDHPGLRHKTTVAICVWTADGQSCKSQIDQNPNFDKSGLVSVEGSLDVKRASGDSFFRRSMSLQLLNKNGKVLTTLDRSTSDWSGGWTLSGQLPTTLPAGTNYVRVKAKEQILKSHISSNQTKGLQMSKAGCKRWPNHPGCPWERPVLIHTQELLLAGFSRNVAIPAV
jgi:hypothetical protein